MNASPIVAIGPKKSRTRNGPALLGHRPFSGLFSVAASWSLKSPRNGADFSAAARRVKTGPTGARAQGGGEVVARRLE